MEWIIFGIIVYFITREKPKKVEFSNFGEKITIMDQVFTHDGNGFYWHENKKFWFSSQNNVNYYGMVPNINLAQQDFLKYLEEEKESKKPYKFVKPNQR